MPPSRSPAVSLLSALVSLALLACGGDDGEPTPPAPAPATLQLTQVASGLSSPVYLTAPAGDARLFIVEQPGRIRVVQSGTLLPTPFLDIAPKVSCCGERGLLSVAFHPSYATNGFFFVNYTDAGGDTRIERYRVSANANVADPASAKLLLSVDQPYSNHNGGLNLFGPDGMLYIGMGDGGSGGDPQNHGQNLGSLLGKLLRIDVDHGDPYAIPPDNPYIGDASARDEIWASGLRNPWRFAFDAPAGLLYVADVGQNELEEISVVRAVDKPLNYGWKIVEGSRCYGASSCDRSGLVLPALEYDHANAQCSVTGGFVYRGSRIAGLAGHYFYSDYCKGFLRSFKYANGQVTEAKDWGLSLGSVLSFGVDAAGELYVLTSNGVVRRIDPAS